ncbi:MAG TPA: serine/threonine-protein kinase [Gemmataceae bacterium]|nr:serine/threonine-protein kinase [Gemmataceae bacterium]
MNDPATVRRRPNHPPTAPLTSVGGYRLLRRLGSGGMAEVYLAYDEERGGPIAVKVLPDDLAKNATYVDRFRREADVGKLLSHPNIVKCFETGQDNETGRYFLVMEFIKGQSAQARLEAAGRFPLSEAVRVVLDVARALEELHFRGYVHRDVKPGNILIGEDSRAKLGDLGVAKLLSDASELTSLDQGIGTPFYMPWEQTLNASLVDPRSDLFALGATFYHLVTGRVPYPGKTVQEVVKAKDEGSFTPVRDLDPKMPKSVDTILAKMLARMPKDRFQNASQLIDVLAASGLADEKTEPSPLADTDLPAAKTKPDLKAPRAKDAKTGAAEVWYVRYSVPDGDWRNMRGTASDIGRWFEEGLLPDEFFVARNTDNPYQHFRSVAAFEDLERRPKAPPPTPARRRRFGFL